jgi:hypothetical protein
MRVCAKTVRFVLPAAFALPMAACGPSDESASGPLDKFAPLRGEGDPAELPAMATTPTGLRYAVLQPGTGERPPAGSQVRVHYTGWILLKDRLGRVIADSRASRKPETFLLAAAPSDSDGPSSKGWTLEKRSPRPVHLAGWLEALSDMRVGERRWLIVPSALAYGSLGFGDIIPIIPRDTDLAFDVELDGFTPP